MDVWEFMNYIWSTNLTDCMIYWSKFHNYLLEQCIRTGARTTPGQSVTTTYFWFLCPFLVISAGGGTNSKMVFLCSRLQINFCKSSLMGINIYNFCCANLLIPFIINMILCFALTWAYLKALTQHWYLPGNRDSKVQKQAFNMEGEIT